MKKVIILRGLPGSGKSTKAKTFGGVVVSADHYFEKTGTYIFDRTKLGSAHGECRSAFEKHITNGEPIIVVDNTNVTKREYLPYAKYAVDHGYEIEIVSLFSGGCSQLQLSERNTHNVPLSTIQRMWEKYQ